MKPEVNVDAIGAVGSELLDATRTVGALRAGLIDDGWEDGATKISRSGAWNGFQPILASFEDLQTESLAIAASPNFKQMTEKVELAAFLHRRGSKIIEANHKRSRDSDCTERGFRYKSRGSEAAGDHDVPATRFRLPRRFSQKLPPLRHEVTNQAGGDGSSSSVPIEPEVRFPQSPPPQSRFPPQPPPHPNLYQQAQFQGNEHRPPRMELPLFSGTDPEGWIYWAERYFMIHRFTDALMLETAIIGLEGDALTCRSWALCLRNFSRHLTALLKDSYCTGGASRPRVPVDTGDLPEACSMGLKDNIRGTLHLLQPIGLAHIMETAQRIDEGTHYFNPGQTVRTNKPNMSHITPIRQSPQQFTTRSITAGPISTIPSPTPATATGKPPTMRRMSETEYQEKRAKGLCFKCDKKYHRGHECEQRLLQVLLFADEDEPLPAVESPPLSPAGDDIEGTKETLATLSLNSLVGISSAHTMKLAGKIGQQTVAVLIDSGATHNFISREIVEATGIPITQTNGYGILLGTGDRVKAEGVCSQVTLELGALRVVTDFLPLELGGADVILGVKWLETLGNMQVNWRTMVMKFERDGTWVTLQGDPSLCKSQISLKAMVHTVEQTGYGFWIPLGSLNSQEQNQEIVPRELEGLLEKYEPAFHMPPAASCLTSRAPNHLEGRVGPIHPVSPRCPNSPSMEAHVGDLEEVFRRLQQHQLYANKKKCVFGTDKVEYLGHIVSTQGVSADPAKVAAMSQWPIPKTIKELRGFPLWYYRSLCAITFSIARPLIEFNSRKMPSIGILYQQAFTQLMRPCVASNKRPIAYFSQALSPRTQAKSVYERELMAIVLAIQKWRPYLLGRRFIVRTDQRSLKYLLEQRLVAEEHQKWLTKLLGYDFEIQYRPGIENKAADALSRVQMDKTLAAISVPSVISIPDLQSQVQSDPFLSKVLRELDKGQDGGDTPWYAGFPWPGRLVLPSSSPFIPLLLQEYHGSSVGGHSGVFKTFQRVAADLYWPGMRKDVHADVWEDISMDFIEGLPMSHGFDSILVVVDRLTKYGHFIPLKHPYSAPTVAEVFVREVVKHHGFPRSIVSDRDKIFLSLFWKELFRLQGTHLKQSTAYHPQSDGQTEVVNRCLETYLRCFAGVRPTKWAKWLAWAEYWYNTSYHVSAGMTPFKALYNRDPPPLIRFEPANTKVSEVEQQLQARDAVLVLLKENLQRAQQNMKAQADKKSRDVHFEIGDLVYVKLRPYRQRTVAKRCNEKLAPRFFGPFPVLARVGPAAYRLQLPPAAAIHPVFHVSLLRAALGPHQQPTTLPPTLTADLEWLLEPEEVLAIRPGTHKMAPQALIKWANLPAFEATWEDFSVIQDQFPHFHLEDKVRLVGGGIDRPPITFVYSRRSKKGAGGQNVEN
uniref:RNA-directed DNA polymerase n=1 Tax=Cannabis sativa TaxID=3483 RepID=A0A803PSM5_CANSA